MPQLPLTELEVRRNHFVLETVHIVNSLVLGDPLVFRSGRGYHPLANIGTYKPYVVSAALLSRTLRRSV